MNKHKLQRFEDEEIGSQSEVLVLKEAKSSIEDGKRSSPYAWLHCTPLEEVYVRIRA